MSALDEDAECDEACARQLTPDATGAIDFLERWTDGTEPRSLLVSIVPDAPSTHGHSFDLPGDEAMARWIERCNRVAGIYWTVNDCRPDLTKKARKADVAWLLGIWGDLDPVKGRDLPAERERLLRLADELMALPWPPTVIIDSGGGIQPLWRLEIPLEAVVEFREAIEWLGRRIEAALGGVENTCNIDRVLRLPFTINHPNRLKVEQGRVPVMSGILAETGRRYSWRDLEALAARLEDEPVANATPGRIDYGFVTGRFVTNRRKYAWRANGLTAEGRFVRFIRFIRSSYDHSLLTQLLLVFKRSFYSFTDFRPRSSQVPTQKAEQTEQILGRPCGHSRQWCDRRHYRITKGAGPMPQYLHVTPEQREMVERWLDRIRKRFAGARDASDIGRVLARERHLETLNQPLSMSAQRFAKLEAEVADVQGEGPFLLVVDCGETGSKATRLVLRFATLEELQQAKRQVDAARCGPGCWRNHLLYELTQEDH